MQLFFVGKTIKEYPDGTITEFQGCFTSEETAIQACKDETYWIGPFELNKEFPAESTQWEGAYFPHGRPN